MYKIKLLAAIGLAGVIHPAGAEVEVDEGVARNLLSRGKAEVVQPEVDEAPNAPTREELDAAIEALPGDYTDADAVIKAMRSYFGDLFKPRDEKKVRELVKPAA